MAQQLIEDGRIGDATQRSSFYGGLGGILDPEGWRRSTQQCGGGIVIDGGTHWVRPLRMWLGEVVEVTGATQRLTAQAEGETLAKAILRHADGRMSSLEAIALPAPCAFSPQPLFVITGTRGEITITPSPTPITPEEIFREFLRDRGGHSSRRVAEDESSVVADDILAQGRTVRPGADGGPRRAAGRWARGDLGSLSRPLGLSHETDVRCGPK